MKSYIKVFAFLFLGLFIAILVYPFLHELGHAIATLAVGVECKEFHLLPAPYVLCDMSAAGNTGYYIVGFAGVVCPMIIGFLLSFLSRKTIYIDYLSFVIEGITLLACMISLISIILMKFGYEFQEDDVINVLVRTEASGTKKSITILFLLFLVIVVLIKLIKQKTLRKTVEYIIKTPENSGANIA